MGVVMKTSSINGKKLSKRIGIFLAMGIVAVCGQMRAEDISLHKPTAYWATSWDGMDDGTVYPTLFDVSKLFDGAIAPADIGGTLNQGDPYVSYGWVETTTTRGPGVYMDFGSEMTFNTLVYSQRTDAYAVATMDIWVTSARVMSTPPWVSPDPDGTPDLTLTIDQTMDGVLRQYDFGTSLTGQYFFVRLRAAAPWAVGSSNHGGGELLMGNVVPEPATLILLGLGSGLAMLRRHRSR
jgi:hypothetical protein